MSNPEQASQLPLFVTIAQAAQLTSTSESTIRRMIGKEILVATYFIEGPRIRVEDLLKPRPKPVRG